MKIQSLGHVVLKVRNIHRAVAFYRDVLGLKEVGHTESGRMVFFSIADNHHDLGLLQTNDAAPDAPADAPGLVRTLAA